MGEDGESPKINHSFLRDYVTEGKAYRHPTCPPWAKPSAARTSWTTGLDWTSVRSSLSGLYGVSVYVCLSGICDV